MSTIGTIKHQIFYFPEAKLRFESLCELKCDTSIASSYFYGLAWLCQYIQRLIIDNFGVYSDNHHGIAKLIRVQKNLKYFEWKDDLNLHNSRPGRDPYEEIVLAIGNKVDTINHLKLDFKYRSPTKHEILPKFYKLKILSVSFYYFSEDFSDFSEERLKMLVYRDLEIFEIDYYELKAAYIIIENSGGHLKKIWLRPIYMIDRHVRNFYDNSLIFIRKVYERCLSIEYLTLIFPPLKQHFNEFEKLLKICQNLKSLLLVIYVQSDARPEEKQLLENGKELLKILIRSAPTSLREIRFICHVKFSLETLEEFLEKWRGRPALSILTLDCILGEKKYKKLINKYKNNGVIKNLKCVSFVNVVNMDFKI
ncbi:6286_t:CDS:1 [Rhizophagus irregularis]|nr:6286_t:CDS:1 [Rhizophagus irregularis]